MLDIKIVVTNRVFSFSREISFIDYKRILENLGMIVISASIPFSKETYIL